MNGEQTVRDLAVAARDFDDIDEALAGAKKEMSRPRGAQYLDEKGRLVHVVPLGDNCLALARSDRSVQILKGAASKGKPTDL